MYEPTLFRDRPRRAQIVLAGAVPAAAGAVAGVLVGVSSGAYWAYGALLAVGALVGGFEHEDGWSSAARGLVGGFIYGIALLVMHAIVGTHAKVSLTVPGSGASSAECDIGRSSRARLFNTALRPRTMLQRRSSGAPSAVSARVATCSDAPGRPRGTCEGSRA
jgi:hypothetical protein